MIIHQGIDIVHIGRIREIMGRHREFLNDIFTEYEREYCLSKRDPLPHLAGRFAVKEAVLKALGIGISVIGIDSGFQEIEIRNQKNGKPVLSLRGWIENIAKKKKITHNCISISHSGDYAVATVVFVSSTSGVSDVQFTRTSME